MEFRLIIDVLIPQIASNRRFDPPVSAGYSYALVVNRTI